MAPSRAHTPPGPNSPHYSQIRDLGYLFSHQKQSILSQDPSSLQVSALFSSFCVILLTNQTTNQQTDMGEKITYLAEVIVANCMLNAKHQE